VVVCDVSTLLVAWHCQSQRQRCATYSLCLPSSGGGGHLTSDRSDVLHTTRYQWVAHVVSSSLCHRRKPITKEAARRISAR